MEKNKDIERKAPNNNTESMKEEFYKWFESKGLLSELRAYMRQLMVKALEESNQNDKTARQKRASTSPKLQAINLLIMDHLFHEDYLYTVSVFASEAQILESLPQYSQYITETVRENRWDPSTLPRFSQQEAEDILDTLRLPPTRQEAHQAIGLYVNGNESLLASVVRTMASAYNQRLIEDSTRVDCRCEDFTPRADVANSSYPLWSKEMQDLLLLAGVKLQHIKRMQQKWAQLLEEECARARKAAEEQLIAHAEQRLRVELAEEMRAEQQQVREWQSRVELRERGLATLADQLTAVHDDINNRLSQIQLQSEEIQIKEARQQSDQLQLEQRLSQLQIREEHLENVYSSLRDQPLEVPENDLNEKKSLEKTNEFQEEIFTKEASVQVVINEAPREPVMTTSTQTLEPVITIFTQTIDTVDHEQQTSQEIQVDPAIAQQLHTDRDKINEMQDEILELRAHALQQRHRIDELTNRAASLSTQLEESRTAVAVLSGQQSAVIATPPPLRMPTPAPQPVPFPVLTFGYNTPQRQGAGEESLFTPRRQQTVTRPESRRGSLRFAFSQNPSPPSEESSPTDEVVQNARARIQQLEHESVAVQRSYQEFQSRVLSSDSVMFPPLGSSRTRNPIMRVRRSELTPYMPLNRPSYQSVLTTNNLNRASQLIYSQGQEDNDESSSDQAGVYDTGRIESFTNTRRLFTQRNMRQFDRWKQFKKKFHRRDSFERRQNYQLSSDDDDNDLFNPRTQHDLNRLKRVHDNQHVISVNKNKIETNNLEGNQSNLAVETNKDNKKSERPGTTQSLEVQQERTNIGNHSNQIASSNPLLGMNSDEQLQLVDKRSKLKIEIEESEKLIESIKVLLGEQNINKAQASTLSNGTVPLESLPIDSQSNESQHNIERTDNSSFLTVQNMNKCHIQSRSHSTSHDESKKSNNVKAGKNSVMEVRGEHTPNKINEYEEEKELDLQENCSMPLTVPIMRLVSPGLNFAHEDFLAATDVHCTDVAEQSEDRGTTSVTSGSDILRELNPSKSESNNSISIGWADDKSKHSSDFWD